MHLIAAIAPNYRWLDERCQTYLLVMSMVEQVSHSAQPDELTQLNKNVKL